jgi:chromosome segregation ATPase
MSSRLVRTRRSVLQVEELESRSLPSVSGPWPAVQLPPRPDLAHIASLASDLDRAQTAVLADLTRQQRDQAELSKDQGELAELRQRAGQVRAAIVADVTATPSQKSDGLAEANRIAGKINHLMVDIAHDQHDLSVVNARLIIDRGKLAQAQAALDTLQTQLTPWPAIAHAVADLRSDLVTRDRFDADLDRVHHAIAADLMDLRETQADLAADHARAHQLQVRLAHVPAGDLATRTRLTAWLQAVQADVAEDNAELQHERTALTMDVSHASQIAQQLYQAENAVAADWRALLMVFITR